MKYYRLNQIAMAVLVALLLFFGARTLIQISQEEHEPEKPGYEVAGTEEKKGEGKAKGPDIAALLAAGNAAHGADVAKKCAVCHSFDKGGPNLIGPNLYGVIGRKVASHEGYEYSDALKAKGGTWDYAMLDHMIENPNAFAPGTKMALFPGLPDAKERADVILFLREKSDSPPPLPEPSAAPVAEAPAEGAPAEGEPAAGKAPGGEILALIATADPKQGEAELALCKVCHTFDKGGATLIGPNLYGVVGKKIASHEGVTYTPALKAKEGDWTYENLDLWLTNPQAFASGTSMAFPGMPDIKKRAAVIAYLRSNAESPIPLPEAAPAAPEEKAPAAEEPAAPAAEAPAAPEAPAAEPAAPAAPEAPSAEPAAPEAPAAEEPAPPAEEPAAEAEPAPSEPSMGEPPSPSQPQPVYPDEEPGAEAPVTTDAVPAEAPASMGEPPSPSQPQPVYPDGPPPGVE
jgi:cytochrome c